MSKEKRMAHAIKVVRQSMAKNLASMVESKEIDEDWTIKQLIDHLKSERIMAVIIKKAEHFKDAENNIVKQPAILKCDCGGEVLLYGFTNTCIDCEADYNFAGQKLAPREQWGEETGEHWIDCL